MALTASRTCLILALGLFAAPAAVAPFAPAAAFADEIDDGLKTLAEKAKAGDENAAVAAIVAFDGKEDARITAALTDLAKSAKSEAVAIAAMKSAAKRKSADLAKWLKTKLEDKKMAEDHPNRYQAVLDSLAHCADKSHLAPLEDVVKKYFPTNPAYAGRAITAYGTVREKAVVDKLLEWLVLSENTRDNKMAAATKENYGINKGMILKALTALTMQDIADSGTWREWWEKEKKTFTFPDPNVKEVDPAGLSEFTDHAYGWTMKKPEHADWKFEKFSEYGGRVMLHNTDEKNMLWARVRVYARKAQADTGGTIETFIKWFEKGWREGHNKEEGAEFEEFSRQPAVEKKMIGGRELHVLSARGKGGGSWKWWSSCERRVYVFMPNKSLFVYWECVVNNAAEDPVKAALWQAVEGVTFKK
ncbi:MAG: hypothetical protein HMLKMBBP_02254 [Planctomycetes bacterium]|nr:hypothetical protein [Planctomycetota bacterium]